MGTLNADAVRIVISHLWSPETHLAIVLTCRAWRNLVLCKSFVRDVILARGRSILCPALLRVASLEDLDVGDRATAITSWGRDRFELDPLTRRSLAYLYANCRKLREACPSILEAIEASKLRSLASPIPHSRAPCATAREAGRVCPWELLTQVDAWRFPFPIPDGPPCDAHVPGLLEMLSGFARIRNVRSLKAWGDPASSSPSELSSWHSLEGRAEVERRPVRLATALMRHPRLVDAVFVHVWFCYCEGSGVTCDARHEFTTRALPLVGRSRVALALRPPVSTWNHENVPEPPAETKKREEQNELDCLLYVRALVRTTVLEGVECPSDEVALALRNERVTLADVAAELASVPDERGLCFPFDGYPLRLVETGRPPSHVIHCLDATHAHRPVDVHEYFRVLGERPEYLARFTVEDWAHLLTIAVTYASCNNKREKLGPFRSIFARCDVDVDVSCVLRRYVLADDESEYDEHNDWNDEVHFAFSRLVWQFPRLRVDGGLFERCLIYVSIRYQPPKSAYRIVVDELNELAELCRENDGCPREELDDAEWSRNWSHHDDPESRYHWRKMEDELEEYPITHAYVLDRFWPGVLAEVYRCLRAITCPMCARVLDEFLVNVMGDTSGAWRPREGESRKRARSPEASERTTRPTPREARDPEARP